MPTEESSKIEERVSALENVLKLDSRLLVLETAIKERIQDAPKPWWKNAKTVTTLGALIAAILPAVTVINNVFASYRESRRLVAEQQEKIRQPYLDRVFRPGISETEQQKVFELLSQLSSDPEMQKWAQQELQRTTETITALNKEKEELQRSLATSQAKLDDLDRKFQKLTDEEKRQRIETAGLVAQLRDNLKTVDRRIGSTLSQIDGQSDAKERASIKDQYHQYKETLAGICGERRGPNEPHTREIDRAYESDCKFVGGPVRIKIEEMEKKYPWLKDES